LDTNIAVIPPPVIGMVMPPAICDAESDQTVTITGTSFLVYDGHTPTVTIGTPPDQHTYSATFDPKDCKPLEGKFSEMNVMLCTAITFVIPAGDFKVTTATKFPVVVQNPPPADCSSSNTVTITIEPPPEVDSVIPATVCEGGSQLTIHGKNFAQGATV